MGGGADLTPYYIYDRNDLQNFHHMYYNLCQKYHYMDTEQQKHPYSYHSMKQACDDYFYLPARQEHRGIGGIFFDDLNDRDPEEIFKFAEEAVNNVVTAYGPIIEKHKDDPFTEEEKKWQLVRRGRYVEFNLVYDRGTVFGLKTGGRIESILMSLPETAQWYYDFHPEPGTKEFDFIDACKNPREWV